jgi:hypothetical protein
MLGEPFTAGPDRSVARDVDDIGEPIIAVAAPALLAAAVDRLPGGELDRPTGNA